MQQQDPSQNPKRFNPINGFFHLCQTEIKRTTAIGMRLISASKLTSDLNESYLLLGKYLAQSIKSGEIEWRDPKCKILMTEILELENMLATHEDEVQSLKHKH